MPINSVADLSIATAANQPAETASQELDRNSFMKLLVAELKNQDPLDPLQAREMVTQLSELTSVEKLIDIEKGIANMQAEMAGVASTQLSDLVGRNVTANVSGITLGTTGAASGSFQVNGRASDVKVTVINSQGDKVAEVPMGSSFPGIQNFTWDGTDADGNRLPPGRYRTEVSAVDDQGLPVATSTEVSGLVSAVSYEGGLPQLVMGNARITLGDVTSIGQ